MRALVELIDKQQILNLVSALNRKPDRVYFFYQEGQEGLLDNEVMRKYLECQYENVLYTPDNLEEKLAEIDADEIDRMFAEGPETEEYKELYAKVQALCNDSRVTFIYVIQPDLTDYAHIRFFISTVSEDSSFEPYEFGYLRETTNDEYKVKYDNLYRGVTEKGEGIHRDRSAHHGNDPADRQRRQHQSHTLHPEADGGDLHRKEQVPREGRDDARDARAADGIRAGTLRQQRDDRAAREDLE